MVLNSTIADNQPAGAGGGVFTRAGTLVIENSTLSGHITTNSGGGLHSGAGTVTLTNTTISNNDASTGGGIDTDAGSLTLGSVTIADNNSGIVNARGVVTLANTILASNGNSPCSGILTSSGHNALANLPGGCTLEGNTSGNVTGDPLLGLLRLNGGTTFTHALLEGSPALDAGDSGLCGAFDQRGAARPQGGGCDIGAYEGIRADCNADIRIDAGDISALTLEIFDGDGTAPVSVPGSDFAGDSLGCNANADPVIDAGDISCLVLIIFEDTEACGIVP
jgi:hypothetical protein